MAFADLDGLRSQACKMDDTPLPFPYQQMTALTLLIFTFMFPIIAVSRFGGDIADDRPSESRPAPVEEERLLPPAPAWPASRRRTRKTEPKRGGARMVAFFLASCFFCLIRTRW